MRHLRSPLLTGTAPASLSFIRRWLGGVCFLVLGIVTVGGITRLTQSGLSMVDWHLLMDMVPPLTEERWREVFARYQQFPQYQTVNLGMTLEAFKEIYFWEYVHRMYGRVIGLVLMLPPAYWLVRRRLGRPLSLRLGAAFALVCFQGFMGWYMVKSGLVNEPRVSHFRLATHLGLALALLGYLGWLWLETGRELKGVKRARASSALRRIGAALLALLALQILWGAFTAGLRAGLGFNTFPLMNGEWIPTGIAREDGILMNLFHNTIAIQFTHRLLGWLLLIGAWAFVFLAKRGKREEPGVYRASHALAGTILIQFLLGAFTVVYVVPVPLAALHQFWACFVLGAAVILGHALWRDPRGSALKG
ncbi:MAG: COX15/CtaA family protein [Bdellovibrionales bacterium]|nr:COX15/CtaA family protein [Bdellovibrionales bacterium]